MKKLKIISFKNVVSLFIGLLFLGGCLGGIAVIADLMINRDGKGVVEIVELGFDEEFLEEPASPFIDISYEDMRVYVFPETEMLIITFPKYVKYYEDGTHSVITIDKNGIIKATTFNDTWDYFIVYCKEDSLFFQNKKEKRKLKEKEGY